MQEVNCYCVLDRKAKVYNTPYFMMNDLVAIRQFTVIANDPESMISKFPEDYILFRVGKFDMLTGKITPAEVIEEVTQGLKVKREVIK